MRQSHGVSQLELGIDKGRDVFRFPLQPVLGPGHRGGQRVERGKDGRNPGQEPMVKINAPKEALKAHLGGRLLHGAYGVKLGWDRH